MTRETREGWALQGPADCWNWVAWGLKEYKWKGSFLAWFVGLVVPLQEIFVLPLLCSSRPSTKYFFLIVHSFNSFVLIAQHAGHSAVLGLRLLVWVWPPPPPPPPTHRLFSYLPSYTVSCQHMLLFLSHFHRPHFVFLFWSICISFIPY